MAGLTNKYALRKPTVGGSENEWGGNLNDNFDDIDKLLSGETPVDGIEIINGSIDGGSITGQLGKEPAEGEDPLKIHESTWISGRVHTLVGLDPNDSDVNMRGPGVIEDCLVKARDLEVEGYITEGQVAPSSVTSANFSANQGTVHVINLPADAECEYNVQLPNPGQSLTLILNKGAQDANATQVTWSANGAANQIKWTGGGAPDLNIGINVIQFFSVNLNNTGTVVVGAFAGTAS